MAEMDPLTQQLKETIDKIQALMETIYTEGTSVDQQFTKLIESLIELDGMKESYAKTYIPLELVANVDDGKSPDEYYASVLEHTKEMDSSLGGQVRQLNRLKDKLDEVFQSL